MNAIHKELAAGRWQELSLSEQLANVGSEVGRMLRWQGRDQKLFDGAVARAFELLDLTIADPRWRKRLKEILRLRELLCDAIAGGMIYRTSFEDLDRYLFHFAVAASIKRSAVSRVAP